jgi:hypothetical protein
MGHWLLGFGHFVVDEISFLVSELLVSMIFRRWILSQWFL